MPPTHARATLVVGLVAALIAGSFIAEVRSQSKVAPRVEQIRGDLYNISGEGGNVAVYVTGEGVMLVDDMYERNYADIAATVKTITAQPIRYVLNTHHHDDHAGGNVGALAAAIEIVAHRNVTANMARLKQPGAPTITFSDEAAVTLGGKEARTHYFGRGHTDGDAVILFPAGRVIHAGDLFLTNRRIPSELNLYVDAASGGSLKEWVTVLDRTLALDFDVVIPGHGALSDRRGLTDWRDAIVRMRDRLQAMIRQGATRDDVVKVLVDEYRWPASGLAIMQVDALIAELR